MVRYFLKSLLSTVFVLVFMAVAHAGDTLTSRELIKAWGVDASLVSLSSQIQSMNAKPEISRNKKLQKAWSTVSNEVYSSGRMEDRLVKEMEGLFADEHARDLAAFLASPLGKRVVELERQSADPKLRDVKMAKGAELWATQNENRTNSIQSIFDSMGGARNSVSASINISFGFQKALQASGAILKSYSDDILWLRARKGVVRSLAPRYRTLLPHMMSFTYRSLSDEDLEGYASFFASDAGRVSYEKMIGAHERMLKSITLEFGRRMMDEFTYDKAS